MAIELRHFCEPTAADYQELLNSPSVRKHMPLSEEVSLTWCQNWMEAKAIQWDETGERGPWSIWIAGNFAGWGGFQPDDEYESAIALVLAKRSWGFGGAIMQVILQKGIELGFQEETLIELPPSRNSVQFLARLGAREVQPGEIQGHRFNRYAIKPANLLLRLNHF